MKLYKSIYIIRRKNTNEFLKKNHHLLYLYIFKFLHLSYQNYSYQYTLGPCLSTSFVCFMTMESLNNFLFKLPILLPLWRRSCLFQGEALCLYVLFNTTLAGSEALVALSYLAGNHLLLGKTTIFSTALFTITISLRLFVF